MSGYLSADLNNTMAIAVGQVSAAVAASSLALAGDVANRAISRGMRHPTLFNGRGLWLQASGQFELALEDFNRAQEYMPREPALHNAIGLCYYRLERYPEAVAAYDAALAIQPNFALCHFRRGVALGMSGDHRSAEIAYQRAIELDPLMADAIGSLSSIRARHGDLEKARELATRALQLSPGQPTARVALAIADNTEKRFVEAEKELRGVLSDGQLGPEARPAVLGLLGDTLDGQKRYAEAFDIYSSENSELRQLNARRFANNRGADATRQLIGYFELATDHWKGARPATPAEGSAATHVFLLGFMRSGTTLLEQVLASNEQIVALEEKGLLNGLGEMFMTSGPSLDALAMLDGEELERHRQNYWQRVNRHIDVRGKIFVDKQPLNTLKLPIIAKLFPNAKILFALRDPRDVVFSCFRRHFRINVTMFEFLDLEDAARAYSSIMHLAEIYRDKLTLNIHEHYYEDMIRDFEKSIRAACDFIGVDWSERMRSFNKYAPAVDLRSPSATQVRRPLYGEGIGQWRRYAEQLKPIFPILQPWVEKFGYPGE